MKKFLLAVGLLLFCYSPAYAGVPCSVPFNLTNGTVADATQVMANYNAILSCLSTSTAASGSNNDITSLNALSTPITPAQGGAQALCGANGFTAKNNTGTPLTEIDLTYTQAIVVNGLGALQQSITPTTLTLNFGTIGAANGLDAGALAASSNYYIYLIGNGTTVASLASLSSTAPALPSGYTFSCRVGAWYSTNLSQLVTGNIKGDKFQLAQKSGGSGSNINAGALQTTGAAIGTCNTGSDTLVLTAYSGLPSTATEAFGVLQSNATNSAAVSNIGPTGVQASEILVSGSATSSLQFDLVLATTESIFICTGGVAAQISIIGWVDSVNAH